MGLTSLDEEVFSGLSSLSVLSFSDVNNFSLTSLPDGIFNGLSSLKVLRFYNSGVESLPAGVFSGLTSLTTLYVGDPEVTIDFTLSLVKVADGQFKATVDLGAVFNMDLPIIVTNGTISDGSTSVTIPTGSTESSTITVTRTAGTTEPVTVNIGTLPEMPSSIGGIELQKDSDLPITILNTGVGAPNQLGRDPHTTALLPNYPNPFNPETWIPYQLEKHSNVTIVVYDIRGISVRRLELGRQAAGFYRERNRAAYWDGRNDLGEKVATGIYFYKFIAGDFEATRKMYIRK
ncbi:T9SS type A sorting domain-containing protein [Candidatus Poribacteria bacterium]|nr:T9SS type A sorting domain-containing protein [Candidatus Poribacteria bacterium]